MQKIYDIQPRVPEIKTEEVIPQLIPKKELKKYSYKKIIVFFIALLVFGLGGYGMKNYFTQKSGGDTTQVLMEVGKLTELPQGETPTIATVTDVKPLQSQEFFKDAQIEDKLLLFTKSKRAILYRPSTNKIIVVAPLNN